MTLNKKALVEIEELRKDAKDEFRDMKVLLLREHPIAAMAPMHTVLKNINEQLGIIIESLKE